MIQSGKRETVKKTGRKLVRTHMFPFQSLRGMRDILPAEQIYWGHIDRVLAKVIQEFGFLKITLPTVEYAEVFTRSVGKGTDIVDKEMYVFPSRGGDILALRPEFTAGMVRAFIQNGMQVWTKPVKLFSQGPVFRYDRPQEGRYRELYQADFEVFGESDPILDAQMIQMAHRTLIALGIRDIVFEVNTLGSEEDKKQYRKALVGYLRSKKEKLCRDCRRRLAENPLRILDCKEEKCRQTTQNAPRIKEHLCPESENHWKYFLEYLDELAIPYRVCLELVRGLDYYTGTVFEVFSGRDEEKQLSLAGGGRYDTLVGKMGGENTPAIGFGIGLDRIVMRMKQQNLKVYPGPKPRVFLAQLGELAKKKSLRLFASLEKNGILVAESFGRGGLKAQLRYASKIGAEITLILGQKEAIDETVIVKDMSSGSQETVSQAHLIHILKKMFKSNGVNIQKQEEVTVSREE